MTITDRRHESPHSAGVSPARHAVSGDAPTGRARLTKAVLANVVLLTMIAPLATDMYVPAFPIVGQDLQASATEVQLTLTTYFVGMAVGQLIGGPVSPCLSG